MEPHIGEVELHNASVWCRMATRMAPDPMVLVGRDGRIFEMNEQFPKFVGDVTATLLGKNIVELLKFQEKEPFMELLQTPTGETQTLQCRVSLDGSVCLDVSAAGMDEDRVVLYIKDVTEHMDTAEHLETSQSVFQQLFENMTSGAALYEAIDDGADFILKDLNAAGCQMTGVTKSAVIGKPITQAFPGVARFGLLDVLQKVYATREPATHPVRYYSDQRQQAWFENRVFYLPSGDVVALYEDVSSRVKTEQALLESETRYALVAETTNDGMWDWWIPESRVFFSPRWKSLLGYTEEEIEDKFDAWVNLIHPDDRERVTTFVEEFLASDRIHYSFDHRLRHKDGSYRVIQCRASCLRDTLGKALRVAGSHTDITQQVRNEAERSRLIAIIEHHTDLIALTQKDGQLLYMNKAGHNLLGLSAANMKGFSFSTPLPQNELLRFQTELLPQMREYGSLRFDISIQHMVTQATIPVQCHCFYLETAKGDEPLVAMVVRDMRIEKAERENRRRMELQMSQQQRLESIGILARGVAHEINNPLTGILAFAELLKRRSKEDEKAVEYLDIIMEESKRVGRIVSNLLAFSREGDESEHAVNLNTVVEDTLSLIQAIFRKESIQTTVTLPEDLPTVRCKPRKLQQALMNLLTNARDSLNAKYPARDPDKRLSISAQTDEQQEQVVLTVRDQGEGIPEGIRQQIFDPFFTTKPRDKSTGLGLSVTLGIIREQGGTLAVQSEPGMFTEFQIRLPLQGTSPLIHEANEENHGSHPGR